MMRTMFFLVDQCISQGGVVTPAHNSQSVEDPNLHLSHSIQARFRKGCLAGCDQPLKPSGRQVTWKAEQVALLWGLTLKDGIAYEHQGAQG